MSVVPVVIVVVEGTGEGSVADGAEVVETSGSSVSFLGNTVAGLVADVADELVEVGSGVVSVVERGSVLVSSVKVDGGGVLDVSGSVLRDDFLVFLNGNVHVTKLDLADSDGLEGGQLLPLDGETLAATTGGVDEGDNPNVFGVSGDGLLESLGFEAVVFLPEAVVLLHDSGLVAVPVVVAGLGVAVRWLVIAVGGLGVAAVGGLGVVVVSGLGVAAVSGLGVRVARVSGLGVARVGRLGVAVLGLGGSRVVVFCGDLEGGGDVTSVETTGHGDSSEQREDCLFHY